MTYPIIQILRYKPYWILIGIMIYACVVVPILVIAGVESTNQTKQEIRDYNCLELREYILSDPHTTLKELAKEQYEWKCEK